jgi:hypothetical protein
MASGAGLFSVPESPEKKEKKAFLVKMRKNSKSPKKTRNEIDEP